MGFGFVVVGLKEGKIQRRIFVKTRHCILQNVCLLRFRGDTPHSLVGNIGANG